MRRNKTPLTLIHNDGAGDARHDRAYLVELLERAGYAIEYVPYKRSDIAAALARPAELVAVGGGDGTIAKIVAAARPDGPPIAILPLGTANNIAKSLGAWRSLDEIVAGWRSGTARPFHPIDSEGPWGRRRLVEGIGSGAIEEAIAELPEKTDHASACQSYADAVMSDDPEELELQIHGETIAERFAVLEISTIPLVGPNLRLAPGADPSSGTFAISFIRDASRERQGLAKWITEPVGRATAPVASRSADHVTISGRFQRIRIDGSVKTSEHQDGWDRSRPITLAAAVEPIPLLVPQ
jgi:diacylglycerol kinase family enzyme